MRSFERLIRSDFAFLLCVTAYQAVVIAGPFLVAGRLLSDSDTLGSYGLFYDNLDSLHRFGEPAWWGFHIHDGTPTYFLGIASMPNLGKPAFVSMGALAWALGRLGIALPFVFPFYVFYFGVLIPFLLLVGVWLVAREILRSRTAIRYTLAVAAFSPVVHVGLTDPGITENTAYGLVCAAAYLRFVGRPSPRTFWALCAASLLVSVAVTSTAAVSAVPMLALLAGASLAVSPAARRALRSVRLTHAVAAVALVVAAASPSLLAYAQQGGRIVNSELGSLEYSFGELKAGNPLQFLIASVPAVPFEWDSYRQDPAGPASQLRMRSLAGGKRLGASYLGLLALPLAATGLALGRRRVRVPLFVMFVAAGAVLVLFAFSPLLAPFLAAFPGLGTVNHFGDLLYNGSAFLVLVFAAGLGLEAAERRRSTLRWLTLGFVGSSLFSLTLFLRWGEPPAALGGFAAIMAVSFAILLTWAVRLPRRSRSRLFGSGLLALTLLDLSTVCFVLLRPLLQAAYVTREGTSDAELGTLASRVTDAGLGRRIGSSDPDVNTSIEMYVLRATKALTEARYEPGVEPARWPFVAGFCAAHASRGDSIARDAALAFGPSRSLALPEELRGEPALAPFFSAERGAPCRIRVRASGFTYNSVQLAVDAMQPGLVFVRDGWSPGWQASVNGSPSEVFPVLGAFKAVPVPAGVSEVKLRFSPPLVGAALLGAYALLAATAIGALRLA